MKYQCSNGHVFLFPMISRVGILENTFTEVKLCPEENCLSRHIEEYVEPKPEISSVVSVDLAQVDSYLAKGYVVHELYAKTATLKMLKVAQVDTLSKDELGDIIKAGIEDAKAKETPA